MLNKFLEALLYIFVFYLVRYQTTLLSNFLALFTGFFTDVVYMNAENVPATIVFLVFYNVTMLIVLR